MQKMRKIKFPSLFVFLTMLIVAFSCYSCSSDDDDNGSSGSSESSVSSQLSGTSWFGSNDEGTILMSLKLYANGKADLKMYGASSIEKSNAPWVYHSSNQTIFITTNPSEKLGWNMQVKSFTGSTMQITFPFAKEEVTFNLERSDGSGALGEIDKPVPTVAYAIVYYNDTQEYAYIGSETRYKKSVGNEIGLYRNSSCVDLLGLAEYNHDTNRGGYDVSDFTYRVVANHVTYTTYYYFN